jgi:hypothetical protein
MHLSSILASRHPARCRGKEIHSLGRKSHKGTIAVPGRAVEEGRQ